MWVYSVKASPFLATYDSIALENKYSSQAIRRCQTCEYIQYHVSSLSLQSVTFVAIERKYRSYNKTVSTCEHTVSCKFSWQSMTLSLLSNLVRITSIHNYHLGTIMCVYSLYHTYAFHDTTLDVVGSCQYFLYKCFSLLDCCASFLCIG